jgi:hypothetical protein
VTLGSGVEGTKGTEGTGTGSSGCGSRDVDWTRRATISAEWAGADPSAMGAQTNRLAVVRRTSVRIGCSGEKFGLVIVKRPSADSVMAAGEFSQSRG